MKTTEFFNSNFIAKAIAVMLPMILLTACSSSETQSSLPANSVSISSDDAGVSDAVLDENESDEQSAEQKDNDIEQDTSDADASLDYDREQRIQRYASDSAVTVYETTLRNGENEYDCRVYIYDLMEETDDTYRGDCAIEISDGGNVVDRTMLTVGHDVGQMGTEFAKNGEDGYFSVAELESGSLLLSMREDGDIAQATIYAVNGDEIAEIERYFADPTLKPEKDASLRRFNLSTDYTTDGDNIIFNINGETVSVTIDFNEMTLRCDESYEEVVYCE